MGERGDRGSGERGAGVRGGGACGGSVAGVHGAGADSGAVRGGSDRCSDVVGVGAHVADTPGASGRQRESAERLLVPEFDALLIDGRSGSGKTSLAARIVRDLREAGADPQLLRVEDLYPGWDGLAEGSRALADVLDRGDYRRYDWHTETFAEQHRLDPRIPLVVEGCGAVTGANLAAAARWAERVAELRDAGRAHGVDEGALGAEGARRVRSVWLECPAAMRRSRALARDGEMYAPHWERWAAQEQEHYAEHQPWRLASEVLRV